MRIVRPAPVPAKVIAGPAGNGRTSPTAIVCAALMLALAFLAFQIAGALSSRAFPDCSLIGDSVEANCPTP